MAKLRAWEWYRWCENPFSHPFFDGNPFPSLGASIQAPG